MNAEQQKLAEETMSDKVDIAKMYVDMEQSKAYAEHREKYTDELFKRISDYCKETNPNLNLAVDVGCGPGVSSTGFAKYFKKVSGFWYHSKSTESYLGGYFILLTSIKKI